MIKTSMIMPLIGDLEKEAELFVANSMLQDVVRELEAIANGNSVDKSAFESFDWVRDLTGQIDFDSKHYHRNKFSEVCVRTTALRPFFFMALEKLRLPWNPEFLERVYETLDSYGEKVSLSALELKQTKNIYQIMASDILNTIQRAHRMGEI